MENWSNKHLGDLILDIKDGGTPNRSISEYFGGEIPWVVIDDIKDEIHKTKENITELGLKKCSSILWDEGDLILSTGATIGIVGITKIRTATKQGICGIRSRPELIVNSFLKYWFQLNRWQLLNNAQGSTIKEIRPSTIAKLKIDIPDSLPEQTRIAEILSTADEAIAHTEALTAKYQRIKTGLMQDLLTKGIDENGNIRSKETHKFVVKNGIEVPEEWEVDTLKNTCNLHNNLRKPIAAIDRFQNKGSFPYYGATGIIDYLNEFRVEGTFVLIGEDGDHYLKFKTQEMTHLVEGKFNVSNHAHILSGKENCSTKWIHYFFCHRDITYFLTRQGAGRFKLNKASLQNLPICVPSPNEQLNIIERIESFNENYNLEKLKLQKLNSLKTGLMQDLLSGKVRVKI
jgi:type I restriction enzyme S subunit